MNLYKCKGKVLEVNNYLLQFLTLGPTSTAKGATFPPEKWGLERVVFYSLLREREREREISRYSSALRVVVRCSAVTIRRAGIVA
jgi:hypothetical protein